MELIEDELREVKNLCERKIPGSKLVACVSSMVRVELKNTDFKNLVVCIQFPSDYPKSTLLIELKSKTLSDKLLRGLTEVTEQKAKSFLGKPQILQVLLFLKSFLDENPLCCCYNEINEIKKLLSKSDELRLKQKTSSINLKIFQGAYYFTAKILIPDFYPKECIKIDNVDTNFPPAFHIHLVGQGNEIARQCIQPPIKPKKNAPPFEPSPSLLKCATFIIDFIKRMPIEKCQGCDQQCFPENPNNAIVDEDSPKFIIRLYCNHLFHYECFNNFMKKPPFGNKKCGTCGGLIYHHKWRLSEKLAEDRWAHEQARERELLEVEDFFK